MGQPLQGGQAAFAVVLRDAQCTKKGMLHLPRGPDVQGHSDVELAPVLPLQAVSCNMDCGVTFGPGALTLCIFLYKAGTMFAA